MNTRIYVITHKKVDITLPKNYHMLQVGAESKGRIYDLADNMGDNISVKNPEFCELTGLYWAWKNEKSEIMGLVHYRRFFADEKYLNMISSKDQIIMLHDKDKLANMLIKQDKLDAYMKEYDIILPIAHNIYPLNVKSQYCTSQGHYEEHWNVAKAVVTELYPDYVNAYNHIENSHIVNFYNMFIAKRSLMESYFEWVFKILDKLEEKIDTTGYSPYERRVCAFLSERLFNVWLVNQPVKIKELPIVFVI